MRAGKHKASRGVSLVEAMVALAVMAFGMLAVVGVQSTLRLNGDIAKQRSEATRIAQENLERDRAFAVIGTADKAVGQLAWEEIVSGTHDVTPDDNGNANNATYRVQRTVTTYADPPSKALRVTVTWNDRAGQEQKVELSSAIAAAAPALSGTLHVRAGTAAVGPVRRPFRRHPSIPAQARDFGQKSGFVIPGHPDVVIVFNNVTGAVTSLCRLPGFSSNEELTSSNIAGCADTAGQLLTGFIRFDRRTELTAVDAENPPGPALNLIVHVNLSSSGHSRSPECFDDTTGAHAVAGDLPFATYYCVIFANPDLRWSGISEITALGGVDWHIGGSDLDAHRVCRYTTAASDTESVANADHPRNYLDVSGNLTNQNFIVIRASKTCPTDVPANPASGDLINSNTLQHQPAPSP
jgi:Tfp pilus assembly protein PilV